MRIRTIKPEFWSHPIMGRLDPETQLLAIALLNHADDEGYFLADPAIVRGCCQPFREDLARISRSLATLSQAGWIELAEHADHGSIGKITKWEGHQKVDHARPSKIKAYFNSRNSRENFAKPRESLAPEQGTGNRDQGRALSAGARGEISATGEAKPPEGHFQPDSATQAAETIQTPTGPAIVQPPAGNRPSLPLPESLLKPARAVFGLTPEAVLLDLLAIWPEDWVRRALSVAIDRGKHSPPYVRGILQRWKANGIPDDKESGDGERQGNRKGGVRAGRNAEAAAKFRGLD